MKKFMNPLVDAGFKRIFGRKMYMREFLNDLLMREHPIRHIWFLDKEMVPDSDRDHGVVYDLYCEADNGEQFIVEIDKWLYVLTNMNRFKSFPFKKDKPIFMQMEELANLSTFSKEEMLMYEKSLDNYRINRLVQETCRDEGFQEGKEQGLKQGIEQGIEQGMRKKVLQIARKMKDTQTPIDIIMEITDLSQDEIEKL